MPDLEPDDELLHARLNAETARIAWSKLQRFFASSRAIHVDPALDLVEIARLIHRDDAEALGAWTARGQVAPVSDAQARAWIAANALVWSVVVKPWVLVQPILAQPEDPSK